MGLCRTSIRILPACVFAYALSWGARVAPAQTGNACVGSEFSIGFQILSVPGSAKMAIWYPTSSRETTYAYSADTSTSLALNGTPATCGRFPLIVFSHGITGCGTQSVFLTEQLARRGYIVAAPDHKDALCSVDGTGVLQFSSTGESFLEPDKWTDSTYLDRATDVRNVLNFLLSNNAQFSNRIDPERIGAMGHSLGGYTVLAMAGAWPRWKDPRIKAVLAISPYTLPFQVLNRLRTVDVPVMYQGAQLDLGVTPFVRGETGAYGLSNLPKYYMELKGGTHFEWTNFICIGRPTIAECLAKSSNGQQIVEYGASFFDRYLKGQVEPISHLTSAGVATYERALKLSTVSAASFGTSPVAPDSIVTGFADALAPTTAGAQQIPLPTSLGTVSVSLTDSSGRVLPIPLFWVSGGQVNYLVPAGASLGAGTVQLSVAGQKVASGTISIDRVAPAIFTANTSGSGVAAGQYISAAGNGGRSTNLLFEPSTREPVPIDLGSGSDQVYLTLYGTGMRGAGAFPTATIGGSPVPVTAFVAHPDFVGLDQINLGPLPRSLTGRGVVNVIMTVDGKQTNPVTVRIK